MKSKMQETMERQAEDLRRLHADTGRIEELAALLADRRVLVIGTGTSWHAAAQGALFLRKAGVDAWAIPSADFCFDGPAVGPNDSVVAMTHTGAKRYTGEALEQARSAGAVTVVISGLGVEGADLETVPRRSVGGVHRQPPWRAVSFGSISPGSRGRPGRSRGGS